VGIISRPSCIPAKFPRHFWIMNLELSKTLISGICSPSQIFCSQKCCHYHWIYHKYDGCILWQFGTLVSKLAGLKLIVSEPSPLVFSHFNETFHNISVLAIVSYCDRSLSVVRRRASCGVRRPSSVVRKLFYLNIFSSETAHWILTKLHRNDPWVVSYQSCSNCSSWLHK